MTNRPRPFRLPRRALLPPIEPMAEPETDRYVKIVRSLADAALVVIRNGDEIRFLTEFGRPTGIVAVGRTAKDAGGRPALTYRIAGSDHVETWMVGEETDVRKVFESFAAFAGRLTADDPAP